MDNADSTDTESGLLEDLPFSTFDTGPSHGLIHEFGTGCIVLGYGNTQQCPTTVQIPPISASIMGIMDGEGFSLPVVTPVKVVEVDISLPTQQSQQCAKSFKGMKNHAYSLLALSQADVLDIYMI